MSRLKAPTTGMVLLTIELRWSPRAHRMTRHRDFPHQRRHDLMPQDEDANSVDFTTCTDLQELITVDEEMTAFDDRPTRQTARPLHANTQGEGTRHEMVTDVGSTDGLDKEDAVPRTAQTTLRMKTLKSEEIKAAWFMVIHDLIPTNDRLAKIQRSTTNNCQTLRNYLEIL